VRNAVNCYRRISVMLPLKYLQSATNLDCIQKENEQYFQFPFMIFIQHKFNKKKTDLPWILEKLRWLRTLRIFLNFVTSCILSWLSLFDNTKGGSPSSFLSYKRSKVTLRVFLAGHTVAMVTYCDTKLTPTRSPMIGQFFDTMILAST